MKRALIILLLMATTPSIAQVTTIDEVKGPIGSQPRSDDLPEGAKGLLGDFSRSATLDSIVPPTTFRTTQRTVSLNAGLGFSCASFNPFDNVESILNNIEESLREIPQQFVQAAEAYVLSLPSYLLAQINPTLYNVITKQIDEGFQIFESEFQNCATLEREIQAGRNPYGQLYRASVLRSQQIIIGTEGITIDEAMETIREIGGASGVVLEDGIAFGGENQEPINISRSLSLAGSNLLLNRPAVDISAFPIDENIRLGTAFESPQEIVDFIRVVYGDTQYSLINNDLNASTPGIGYQHEYIQLRNDQIGLLRSFVRGQINRVVYEAESQSQISPARVQEFRQLSPTQQDIEIDDYARNIAIRQMLRKLDFAALAIQAGLREPNIRASSAFEVITDEAQLLIRAIRADIAHLNNARTF